jgi:hypothetical protein
MRPGLYENEKGNSYTQTSELVNEHIMYDGFQEYKQGRCFRNLVT